MNIKADHIKKLLLLPATLLLLENQDSFGSDRDQLSGSSNRSRSSFSSASLSNQGSFRTGRSPSMSSLGSSQRSAALAPSSSRGASWRSPSTTSSASSVGTSHASARSTQPSLTSLNSTALGSRINRDDEVVGGPGRPGHARVRHGGFNPIAPANVTDHVLATRRGVGQHNPATTFRNPEEQNHALHQLLNHGNRTTNGTRTIIEGPLAGDLPVRGVFQGNNPMFFDAEATRGTAVLDRPAGGRRTIITVYPSGFDNTRIDLDARQ